MVAAATGFSSRLGRRHRSSSAGAVAALWPRHKVLARDCVHGQPRVALQMAEVTMDGHEKLRPHEVDHHAQLFLRAVAGDMDKTVGAVVVDNARITALEVIDDAIDGLLVAGDDS